MSGRSKNDLAWETLFETHHILDRVADDGVCKISRTTIDQVRDSRLMTSFNHRIQLPSVFKDQNLSIQQQDHNTFVIGPFISYFDLPSCDPASTEAVPLPAGLETIDPGSLHSGFAALLCAYNAGMLNVLMEQSVALTVVGLTVAGNFAYQIEDTHGHAHEIKVGDLQLQLDGGFEGSGVFAIIDAKNETVSDFFIKRLYYPYRAWSKRTRKAIVPVFMSYSNDLFSFYLFRFNDRERYNSIELYDQRNFQLGSSEVQLADIVDALNRVSLTEDPTDIPFPQADSFARIIDLLSQLYNFGTLSQEGITLNYAFDLRQTQYYTNAARYLGLVVKTQSRDEGVSYSLSARGASIMSQRPASRNLKLAELILEHRIFNNTARLYLTQAERPTTERVIAMMRTAQPGLDLDGETTIPRRAQTVLAWVDWMMRLTRN